jgi:hypothetical protein
MGTGSSPLAGGSQLINGPIVDPKTGTPTFQFIKWFQDASTRLQNGLNQIGQLIGIISAETKIAGRSGTIGTALQHLDGTGLLNGAAISGVIPAVVIPAPTTGAFGGVKSNAPVSGQFVASIDASGTPQLAQPNFADVSGTVSPAQLPTPTPTTLGGVMARTVAGSQWLNSIDATGTPQSSQPAFTDISGALALTQLPANVPQVAFGSGAPSATSTEGFIYFDTTATPYQGYTYHSGAWAKFS